MVLWAAVFFAMGFAVAAVVFLSVRRPSDAVPPAADDRIIEISQLSGGLAHEIRNPLSTLLLNLKLLEEDLGEGLDEDSDTLRRARLKIGVARGEAERLQRQLDEFLLLVGPIRLQKQVVDLNEVVDQLVEFYGPEAARHRITLRPVYCAGEVSCQIDHQVFQQAILNLLINAQQSITDGGDIMITTSAGDGWATLEIADTGEGMPQEVAAKAMQAFYSTKPKGSGLGLSTTSRIVTAHGGSMRLDSEPDVGTRFEIRLPLARRPTQTGD